MCSYNRTRIQFIQETLFKQNPLKSWLESLTNAPWNVFYPSAIDRRVASGRPSKAAASATDRYRYQNARRRLIERLACQGVLLVPNRRHFVSFRWNATACTPQTLQHDETLAGPCDWFTRKDRSIFSGYWYNLAITDQQSISDSWESLGLQFQGCWMPRIRENANGLTFFGNDDP